MLTDLDCKLNSVLVDNWLLELATSALDLPARSLPSTSTVTGSWYLGVLGGSTTIVKREASPRECLIALFYLLDILILHDCIVYDEAYAFSWKRSSALSPIHWLLQPLRRESASELASSHDENDLDLEHESPMIARGAESYLALAGSLGLYYWPSPRRSEYIRRSRMPGYSGSFVAQLPRMIDAELSRVLDEVLKDTGMRSPCGFAGFGSAVLNQCDSPSTILQTALQVRSTKSCHAFREWLVDMDSNLRSADLTGLARGLREVRDVLDGARRELGLKEVADDPRFTLALSPSVSFPARSASRWLDKLRRAPYHVVFLRQHVERLLSQRRIAEAINRLFGSHDVNSEDRSTERLQPTIARATDLVSGYLDTDSKDLSADRGVGLPIRHDVYPSDTTSQGNPLSSRKRRGDK